MEDWPLWADLVVELRGFKPLTSAVRLTLPHGPRSVEKWSA
jgi:hypothetical protein